jgi:hypothetical protein
MSGPCFSLTHPVIATDGRTRRQLGAGDPTAPIVPTVLRCYICYLCVGKLRLARLYVLYVEYVAYDASSYPIRGARRSRGTCWLRRVRYVDYA